MRPPYARVFRICNVEFFVMEYNRNKSLIVSSSFNECRTTAAKQNYVQALCICKRLVEL